MNITSIHIHRHVIAHSHQKITIGINSHIIRYRMGKVAIFKIKELFAHFDSPF